jgi:SAM-dependent methyltransferase
MNNNFYRTFEEQFYASRDAIFALRKQYLPFVKPLADIYKNSNIFDIGCGRGEWLSLMQELGFEVLGVDLDEGMLQDCWDRNLPVKKGDAVEYLKSMKSESQTVISAFHVIEHISFEAVNQVIFESARILRPGGILIMETPNPENLLVSTQNFYLDPTHIHPIPSDLLTFLTKLHGFQRVKLLRMHEDPLLVTNMNPSLMDVFRGASPDYAVIVQKEGPLEVMEALSTAFQCGGGISLEEIVRRYDERLSRAEQAENVRQLLRKSKAWRLARWIHNFVKISKNTNKSPFKFIPTVVEKHTEHIKCSDSENVLTELDSFGYKYYSSISPSGPCTFRSDICRSRHFLMPLYTYWCQQLREKPRLHRKQWEFVFITHALYERGYLQAPNKGLGFGVGKEPLPSLFAALGCKITATDVATTIAQELGWATSDQHAASCADLNQRKLCNSSLFQKQVDFQFVDMNFIPDSLNGYDFCWSSCALEHLGSIYNGLTFILKSLDTLKPGGLAIHTTEFNLSSNSETVDNNKSCVIFRRKDMEMLISKIRNLGHHVEEPDFSASHSELDRCIDMPPYRDDPHIRLNINNFNCTSIGLIIRKGNI